MCICKMTQKSLNKKNMQVTDLTNKKLILKLSFFFLNYLSLTKTIIEHIYIILIKCVWYIGLLNQNPI